MIKWLVIFVLFFCACKSELFQKIGNKSLPYFKEASFTPHWLSPNDPSLKDFHTIPDFNFTNQDGQAVSLDNFKDKIFVTDFFFTTCPGICPKMTGNLGLVQEAFLEEDEVLFLSHSVMPTRDSVSVLNAYAEKHNVISGKWHLVTGDRQEIYDMGREAYFVEEDLGLEKEPDEFLHTENFVLVDQNGYIRGIYNGINKTSVNDLISDIRLLLSKKTK